ncbi:MAG: CdaR family protein [Oscillospiraceae bacterium]
MKMKKKNILYNNNFLRIFSIVFAALIWYVVVTTVSQNITVKIKDVPVNFDDFASSSLGKIGLNPINIDKNVTVDVLVSGNREEVGAIKKDDIKVVPDLSKINVAGVYDVDLSTENNQMGSVKVESIFPKQLSIQFDRIASRKLTVEANVEGISVPEGYMMQAETVSPKEITISGPEIDVSKVYKVVATAEVNKTVEETYSQKTKIQLLDRDMNVISSKYVSSNYDEVTLSVPVLKIKKVPFEFEFLNVPEGLPVEDIDYEFTEDYIEVAAPVSDVENLTKINLGYIDINDLKDKNAYKFDVELPQGYINIQNIKDVIVKFDTENMAAANIIISDIKAINVPAIYDVTIDTRQIDVSMFGDKDIIATLTSGDVVAEIDFSDREIGTGKSLVPVKIYAPTSGLVWATGDYEAVIDVVEK